MKTPSLIKSACAAAIALAGSSAHANSIIDVAPIFTANGFGAEGTANGYDHYTFPLVLPGLSPIDADSKTGLFDALGVSNLLATSVYKVDEPTDPAPCTPGASCEIIPPEVFGSFFDTNKNSILTPALGTSGDAVGCTVPTPGGLPDPSPCANLPALPTVTLTAPVNSPTPGSDTTLENMPPLNPPAIGVNVEGFNQSWALDTEYYLEGNLLPGGPDYTMGTIDIYFQELFDLDGTAGLTRTLALTLTLIDDVIAGPNLTLLFDVTFALPGFLEVNGRDAAQQIIDGDPVSAILDTNVNPPIPLSGELLAVDLDGNGSKESYIRQSDLNATIVFGVPEPTTLLLLGAGVLGLSMRRKRISQAM